MTSAMTARIRITLLTCLISALSGCAVGPDYLRPDVETPAQFKEIEGWKVAEPGDEAPRGKWWESYGDAQLNALVEQIEISNQNVRAAEAQYRQAVGVLGVSRAAYFPSITSNFSASRAQGVSSSSTSSGSSTISPGSPIRNTDRLSLGASWEADVWGRISRNVESSTASVQASAGDLQAALLSAQSTLVQTYMQLRANDAQRRLLEQTAAAYQRTLEITRNRYDAGVAGRIDVAQAESQLKTTQAQAIDLGVLRAQYEHAIAALLGRAPADFSLAPTGVLPELPQIPVALPSALLERRPDVAAAERRAAAANAQIGVVQAAFFPSLILSTSGGFQGTSLSQLLTLPNRFWSVGPALALTLFDAGARSSQKEQAIALYDKSVATYRQTVLTAFQEVEDNLASLRILEEEASVQREAAKFAAESLRLTQNQYQSGTVSYLNVVIAQAAALSADRSSIDISGRRLLASAALLKALGGDWHEAKVDVKAVEINTQETAE
jgi:NodT family efflux transporter outer membrane factor (OMF) lipoprotein